MIWHSINKDQVVCAYRDEVGAWRTIGIIAGIVRTGDKALLVHF